MSKHRLTLIDEQQKKEVEADFTGGEIRLSPEVLHDVLGWELKPQGLCKGDICVPIRGRAGLVSDAGIELAGIAELLDRPMASDLDHRVACLAAPAATRAAQLRSLDAPDFTLPDSLGHPHSLRDFRGKKVFLVAYASW